MKVNSLHLPLQLNPRETYPFLGMDEKTSSETLNDLIQHYVIETQHLAKPVGIWKTFNIQEKSTEQILLKHSSLIINGHSTINHFLTSEKVTLLATTIGQDVTSRLAEIISKEPSHGLIFDAVASAAVEKITQQLDNMLSQEIRRQGYYPTARLSPGYGGWDLKWQKNFLESLEADKINLSVTPYYILQPVKSVTAVIGWSKLPIKRAYEFELGTKPCQGSETCPHCPLFSTCQQNNNKLSHE